MAAGIASALLALLALLAVPVTLSFRFALGERRDATLRLGWAFGLVSVELRPPSAQWSRISPSGSRGGGHFLSSAKRRRRLVEFAHDVWRSVDKKDVGVRIRIGASDPAETGMLWGVLGPLSAGLAQLRDISVQIVPSFLDDVFEVRGSGELKVVPLRIAYLVVGLALSPEMRR